MTGFAKLPIGPILLAAFLPIHLWQLLVDVYSFGDALRSAFLLGILVLVGVVALGRILERWTQINYLASVAVAAVVYAIGVAYPLYVLLAFGVLTTLIERRFAHEKLAGLSNVLGLAVFAAFFATHTFLFTPQKTEQMTGPHLAITDLTATPSILHIVLDGYGASDVMKEYFDHDNTAFRAGLSDLGFSVLDGVVTPYSQTVFVMSAMMSGGYVDPAGPRDSPAEFRRQLGRQATNGTVHQSLRKAGYAFSYSPSGFAGMDLDDAKRIKAQPFWMPTTMDAAFFDVTGDQRAKAYNRLIKAGLRTQNFDDLQPPFYHYQHILAPHPPFTLTDTGALRQTKMQTIADGSDLVQGTEAGQLEYLDGYRHKARFVETALLEQLRARPDQGPVVIIIHGDHGPGAYLDHQTLDATCTKERMTSFLAVYSNIPEVRAAFASQDAQNFNLVNVYRQLFSVLGSTPLEQLPNHSYFASYTNPGAIAEIPPASLSAACTPH